MAEGDGTIYSFVVDDAPHFTYQAWHLAHSLIRYCGLHPSAIHVQCVPEISGRDRAMFAGMGCQVHRLQRFGDGRHCNKLGQLENLREVPYREAVLLDTDTIAVSDLRPFLNSSAILGKIVDLANPSLATLGEIAADAGLTNLTRVRTDAGDGETYMGNCNGGFYSVPKALAPALSAEWRRWALWLLECQGPLHRAGKQIHVDQVSFWLALHSARLSFEPAPSNVNYYVHQAGSHGYFDRSSDIALLHYHSCSLNVMGLLEPAIPLDPTEQAAVKRANQQIGAAFDDRVFRD